MGEVFLADGLSLGRKVALKFLSPEMQRDPIAQKRLLHEAKSRLALLVQQSAMEAPSVIGTLLSRCR